MTRVLIALAVLVSGCEQLQAPKKIAALEERVDQLSGQVEALKAGPARTVAHAGSADQKIPEAGSGSAAGEAGSAAGSGEAGSAGGSGSAGEAGSGETGSASEPAAAGAGSAATEPRDGAQPPGDAGVVDGSPADRALADLQAVVSRMTGKRAESTAPGAKQEPAVPGAKQEPAAPGAKQEPAAPGAKQEPAAPGAKQEPAAPGPATWSYDGKTGSPMWGTLDPAWATCLKGKAQSPIDIMPRAGTAQPIAFHYRPGAATIVDNGHGLQVNPAPGSTIEIDGRSYQLVQLRFHAPGEHTIAGERYPLEVQLIHQAADGKLAVIGVLYDAGGESRALGALWARWPRKVGAEDKLRKPFDPSELLPETRTAFRYTGSLTTPPCTEGVIWNVMRRAMSDSRPHLEEVARHYPHNAREPQALGDRKIE